MSIFMLYRRSLNLEKDEALKFANAKVDHEHSRWNTWALFFFGLLISIFTVWSQVKSSLPSYIPFLSCSILSCLWLFVALGTRRVTASWVKVINRIERSSSVHFRPNSNYKRYETVHSFCKDILRVSPFRVTKVLAHLGVILTAVFFSLAVYFYCNPIKNDDQVVEIKHLHDMLNSIQVYAEPMTDIQQRFLAMEKQLERIEKKVNEKIVGQISP